MLGQALLIIGALGAFAATPTPSIRLFESRVSLNEKGAVDVTERIRFGAGVRIEREIPTRRLLWTGLREVSRVELVNAILDGEPVSLAARSTPRGVLWSPALPPGPGEHTLILRYRADARVFAAHEDDQLVWDATGSRWKMPVEEVRVTLLKPASAATLNYSILSGRPDALVDIERRTLEGSREVRWTRTDPLPPGEGVQVILRFPRGTVRAGTPPTLSRKLRDNLHVALGFFGVAALALFVFLERLALNRDPDPEAKHDGPGADLSYAAARVLVDGHYSGRALQAGVAGLIAKRWLSRVEERDSSWTLVRGEGDGDALTVDERALGDALMGERREATLAGSAGFENALNEHARVIEGLWTPLVRARAWTQWACAAAWSAGIVSAMRAAASLFEPVPMPVATTLGAGALSAFGGAVVIIVLTLTYKAWRAASLPDPGGKPRLIPLLAAIALGFLSFGLITASATAFQTVIGDLAPAALLAGFGLLFVNWIAFYALRGPTPEGFDILRRARVLAARGEEKIFKGALAATEPLVAAVDGRL